MAHTTNTFTCRVCNQTKPQRVGRGRPWVMCRECKEASGSLAYELKDGRTLANCRLCSSPYAAAPGGADNALCPACTQRARTSATMNGYRRTLLDMRDAARKRMKRKESFAYLEARCAICGHAMWLDVAAVKKGVRVCSQRRCQYERRWARDTYKDTQASKNHRRRIQYEQGDDIRKSIVWERDMGMCHLCGEAADRDDWHLDHIVPLARGGTHTWDNVAVSHPSCNLSKGARAA